MARMRTVGPFDTPPAHATASAGCAKLRRRAQELHGMLRLRLQALDDESESATPPGMRNVELGLPYPHPADALGRTWNIAELRGLRSNCIAPARLLIDSFREAYDIEAR